MNALAHRGDEGRTRLRKATVSCQETLTRRFPNGATHHIEICGILKRKRTQGSEHLSTWRKDITDIPKVVASEMGRAPVRDSLEDSRIGWKAKP